MSMFPMGSDTMASLWGIGQFGKNPTPAGGGMALAPWLQGAGLVADIAGGIDQMGKAKRAKKSAEARKQAMLANVAGSASLARQDAQEASGRALSMARTSAEGHGGGATTWDSALNGILSGRGKAMSAINQGEADRVNQILGTQQETVTPSPFTGLAAFLGKAGALSAARGMAGGVRAKNDLVTAQLNGADATARLNGGGDLWDQLAAWLN